MKKIVVILLLLAILLLAGCEALTMTPDAWLDPYRWDTVKLAKAEPASLPK